MNLMPVLMVLFFWTSAWSQEMTEGQYSLQNTKISIDPTGFRILVAYGLKSENQNVIMVRRENEKFSPIRIPLLSSDIRYLGFSSDAQYLLEVSKNENRTSLRRINVETSQSQLIYSDPREIWAPREIGVDDYVYFQATAQIPSQGVWVRQQGGLQKILFSVPDRLSSKMNWTENSLYVMSWTRPRSFFAISGRVPDHAERLAKESGVWEISCANTEPLQCVREKVRLTRKGYLASVEMTKGSQICAIPGQWADLRELQISDGGGYAIFHAKTPESNGSRSIYVARYSEKECVLDVVFSERDGKWELQ